MAGIEFEFDLTRCPDLTRVQDVLDACSSYNAAWRYFGGDDSFVLKQRVRGLTLAATVDGTSVDAMIVQWYRASDRVTVIWTDSMGNRGAEVYLRHGRQTVRLLEEQELARRASSMLA